MSVNQLHNQFAEQLTLQFADYVKNNNITNHLEISCLIRSIFDHITETALQETYKSTDAIQAPNAVVEVIDEETGQLIRRYLELTYQENSNGLRLIGEDLAGQESQIVFLSETAIAKMQELQGNGADEPSCH